MDDAPIIAKKSGMGCLSMLTLIIVLFMIVIFGVDEGYGFYASHCGGKNLIDCILNKSDTMELTPTEKSSMVTAMGTYSFKGYSVEVKANIPLSGGPVTGVVTGDCFGKMKGSFAGNDRGAISGTMNGACGAFLVNVPASATYTGYVSLQTRRIPITFSGQTTGGLSHDGTMELTY